jgi:hypothetical protein
MWLQLGDTFFLLGFRVFANITFGIISFMSATLYMSFYIAESNRHFAFAEIFALDHGNDEKDNLNDEYYRKFCKKVKIVYYTCYANILCSSVLTAITFFAFLSLWAINAQDEYQFNPLVLLFWYVNMIIWAALASGGPALQVLMFYMSTLYIRYRYKQVENINKS